VFCFVNSLRKFETRPAGRGTTLRPMIVFEILLILAQT
jgi:hypothetical protein